LDILILSEPGAKEEYRSQMKGQVLPLAYTSVFCGALSSFYAGFAPPIMRYSPWLVMASNWSKGLHGRVYKAIHKHCDDHYVAIKELLVAEGNDIDEIEATVEAQNRLLRASSVRLNLA
jgi:hypothetical protein